MGSNLAKVLPNVDTAELVSVVAQYSKKFGAMIGRAAWNNGRTAIKIITKHGGQVLVHITVPQNMSKNQRDGIIHDFSKLGLTQALIGAATHDLSPYSPLLGQFVKFTRGHYPHSPPSSNFSPPHTRISSATAP